MTRMHLYTIALCVLASTAATAQASDTSADYGTGESVTRDRYSDKFMNRPGAAEVTGRSGGRLPSQRPSGTVSNSYQAPVPQIPSNQGPDREIISGPNSRGASMPQGSGTDAVVQVDSKAPVSDQSAGQSPQLTRSVGQNAVASSAYSRGYNEPLINGLRALAPDRCELDVQDGIQDTSVTWKSNGLPWDQVMRPMVNDAGLYLSIVNSPCLIAVATSPGMAQRMANGSSTIPNGPDPYATAGEPAATGADGPDAGATDEPNTHLTYQEYLAEYITPDLRAASLQEVFEAITPLGWDVRLEIEDSTLLNDTYDITAETTRGQIIASLEHQLRVQAEPYVENRILVVSEQ